MTIAIATLHLKLAIQQPGCPICRVRRESEARYIYFFLYENINYARKRAWDNRHEPMMEAERKSAERAAGFFGGLAPEASKEK